MRALEDIIRERGRVAFLIGNGPNLAAGIMPSWKTLLASISDNPIRLVDGLSNTEVYDLVELNSADGVDVKARVVEQLQIHPTYNLEVHRSLMTLAKNHDCPVLTTNFEETFERSIDAKQFHIDSRRFTRFYPWKTYYGLKKLDNPMDGFGIWKIHGDVRYKDSIRLGLTDYMGSAERARRLIHRDDDSLFRGKREDWRGWDTWLHIWFNMPIVIFGLGFSKDEVFLRWLLIERRRYKKIRREPMEVDFLAKGFPAGETSNLVQNLDVNHIEVGDYSELYGNGRGD